MAAAVVVVVGSLLCKVCGQSLFGSGRQSRGSREAGGGGGCGGCGGCKSCQVRMLQASTVSRQWLRTSTG